eukprot:1303448-Pleurochrysis_carterae.AAC.2
MSQEKATLSAASSARELLSPETTERPMMEDVSATERVSPIPQTLRIFEHGLPQADTDPAPKLSEPLSQLAGRHIPPASDQLLELVAGARCQLQLEHVVILRVHARTLAGEPEEHRGDSARIGAESDVARIRRQEYQRLVPSVCKHR